MELGLGACLPHGRCSLGAEHHLLLVSSCASFVHQVGTLFTEASHGLLENVRLQLGNLCL